MHELSITRNIVAIVADRAQGQPVLRVRLEVGRLSGVLADAIRFCFEACCHGTALEGATLEIVETEGRGHCDACGTDSTMTAPLGRCPACGELRLRIVAGDELKIKEMEVGTCA